MEDRVLLRIVDLVNEGFAWRTSLLDGLSSPHEFLRSLRAKTRRRVDILCIQARTRILAVERDELCNVCDLEPKFWLRDNNDMIRADSRRAITKTKGNALTRDMVAPFAASQA